MDTKEFTDLKNNLKSQVKEFETRMRNEGKDFFKNASQEIFKKFPNLVQFGWNQYTPYFNDGEECVFSAQLDYPWIQLGGEEENEDRESYYPEGTEGEKVLEGVTEFLTLFDDDDVRLLFGDHVEVIVTRNKVKVEEYEHD